MALVKTFVSKVETPWGDVYHQAVVGIVHTEVFNKSSDHADNITGEVTSVEGAVASGTFRAAFFNSAQTQAQNKLDRPVLHVDDDGLVTDVFIIDMDDEQVKQILAGPLTGLEERENIARVQLIKHFA